jgi:hypothetical protein
MVANKSWRIRETWRLIEVGAPAAGKGSCERGPKDRPEFIVPTETSDHAVPCCEL